MKLTEFHNFISDIAGDLPDEEAKKLMAIGDSFKELGPNKWVVEIAKYVDYLLINDIGDSQKNSKFLAEAENVYSKEIKFRYIILAVLIIVVVVYYV